MKSLFLYFFLSLSLFCFIGCGSDEADEEIEKDIDQIAGATGTENQDETEEGETQSTAGQDQNHVILIMGMPNRRYGLKPFPFLKKSKLIQVSIKPKDQVLYKLKTCYTMNSAHIKKYGFALVIYDYNLGQTYKACGNTPCTYQHHYIVATTDSDFYEKDGLMNVFQDTPFYTTAPPHKYLAIFEKPFPSLNLPNRALSTAEIKSFESAQGITCQHLLPPE